MDRAEYHDTRRTIYRLEIESRLLAAHNRRYPYYGTARDTTADYVAKLRRTIRVPTDQYTASRNQRWASLRRALQQAARGLQSVVMSQNQALGETYEPAERND